MDYGGENEAVDGSGDGHSKCGVWEPMIEGRGCEREAAVLERITDAVFSLDDAWRFTYCNERAGECLGADPGALVGTVIWDRFPETRETAMPEEFHRARADGTRRSFEVYHRPRETWLSVTAYPDAEDGGITVLLQPAPDREGRDRALRRRAAMVDAADVPMAALDGDGRLVDLNAALLDLAGRARTDLVGRRLTALFERGPSQGSADRLRAAVEAGERIDGVAVTVATAGDGPRRCEAGVVPLAESAPAAAALTVRDVTHRQGRRQRLAVLDRVLREDLRPAMHQILCRAERLAEREDPDAAATADGIATTARDLLATSEAIRRFADAVDPDLGEARPRDAVDHVRDRVEAVRERHPGAAIHFLVRASPWLRVHESTLLAVEELVTRAVESGRRPPSNGRTRPADGDPEVTVTLDATGQPDDGRVRIRVTAGDAAFSSAERRVLVEGDPAGPGRTPDLELWLATWAIRKSGGECAVEETDEGTTLTVELPRCSPS